LTPLADAYKGFLKTPHVVTEMVEAFARGARMNMDLMGRWDFWAVMDQPLAEVRRRYGIGEPAPRDTVSGQARRSGTTAGSPCRSGPRP
jgi:hypothetical protein